MKVLNFSLAIISMMLLGAGLYAFIVGNPFSQTITWSGAIVSVFRNLFCPGGPKLYTQLEYDKLKRQVEELTNTTDKIMPL